MADEDITPTEGAGTEEPRVPNRDKHATVGNIRAFWNWMKDGGVPGTAITPGTMPSSSMADNSVQGAVVADGSIMAAKLAPDVWDKVNQIMDEGFGEILNGEY